MRVLVIGLGSMGKRRIRCLQTLGVKDIVGFDLSPARVNEAKEKYGVPCSTVWKEAFEKNQPQAFIISVPPAMHHVYIRQAMDLSIHFFVEASVVDTGLSEFVDRLKVTNLVAAPSATLYFHPAIQLIKQIVQSGELGKLSNILLHSGQYLPDWHTYESVADYYVSNPATSGGREIVPFELSWFLRVFGWPSMVSANYRKTIEISGAEYIDDTYNILLDYRNYLAVVTVDVVSRYATRRLVVNGSEKQLVWSWDENCVKVFDPVKGNWEVLDYSPGTAEAGYNANIGEKMYVDEIANFLGAIDGREPFFNTLAEDHSVLKLLYAAERSDSSSAFQVVP